MKHNRRTKDMSDRTKVGSVGTVSSPASVVLEGPPAGQGVGQAEVIDARIAVIEELEASLKAATERIRELEIEVAKAGTSGKLGLVKAGSKMPDGLSLQRDTPVEYEMDGDEKVVTGPKNIRPAILMGYRFR